MATIQIINQGASLKVVINNIPRYITKSQVREIGIVKDTFIKLDTGQGIHNLYLNHPDVTAPVTATPELLREAINNMLLTGGTGSGTATEAKQDSGITELQNLKTEVQAIKTKMDTLND